MKQNGLKGVLTRCSRDVREQAAGVKGAGGVSDEHDERALIERCRAGDDAAFGELVDLHKNLVYGLVYRMVSDRSRVDDLAQDVFLKVHRGLPYFRGEARLSTWIYRIVQNVCCGGAIAPRAGCVARRDDEPAAAIDPAPPTGRSATWNCATGSRKRSPSCPRRSACSLRRTIWTACSTRRWPNR